MPITIRRTAFKVATGSNINGEGHDIYLKSSSHEKGGQNEIKIAYQTTQGCELRSVKTVAFRKRQREKQITNENKNQISGGGLVTVKSKKALQ